MKTICFPFLGDKLGGSHKSILILIKNLDKKNFKPVVVLHSKGILKKFLDNQSIKYISLPLKNYVGKKGGYLNTLFSTIYTTTILSKFILKNNISIIHTNDVSMHLSWSLPSFLMNRKLIWHCRILYPNWRLFKVFSFFPKKIICISNFVYKSIPKILVKKSLIIYNPFEIKKVSTINNTKLNNKKNLIGFVANFWNRKKPLDFINIAEKIISKSKRNFVFFMAGYDKDTKKRNLIEEIKKRGLEKKFILKDFIFSVDNLIKNLDLLIVPAINEPFGRTLIEAMFLKTPVLANNSGGHREIIKNNYNGWLYKLNNINSAVNLALQIIYKKKKTKKVLNNAFYFVNTKFSLNQHVKKVSQLYNLL